MYKLLLDSMGNYIFIFAYIINKEDSLDSVEYTGEFIFYFLFIV